VQCSRRGANSFTIQQRSLADNISTINTITVLQPIITLSHNVLYRTRFCDHKSKLVTWELMKVHRSSRNCCYRYASDSDFMRKGNLFLRFGCSYSSVAIAIKLRTGQSAGQEVSCPQRSSSVLSSRYRRNFPRSVKLNTHLDLLLRL
jgi:hypothetical protein